MDLDGLSERRSVDHLPVADVDTHVVNVCGAAVENQVTEFGLALLRYRGRRGVLRMSGARDPDVRDSVGGLGQARTVETRVTGLVAVTAPHVRQTDLADGEVHRP